LFPWSYDTAFLAALIMNLMRKKDSTPYNVTDFMPADREEIDPIEQTWENLRAIAKETDHGSH
jgi:hypothetical protein